MESRLRGNDDAAGVERLRSALRRCIRGGARRTTGSRLLERNFKNLRMENGEIKFDLRGYGFAAVRLLD